MSELAPCPFCGNAKLDHAYGDMGDHAEYWIECPKCEVILSRNTKAQAYADWNTRNTSQHNAKCKEVDQAYNNGLKRAVEILKSYDPFCNTHAIKAIMDEVEE